MTHIEMTPSEMRIWDAAFGAAFVHAERRTVDDEEAARFARSMADRAVRSFRALRQADDRQQRLHAFVDADHRRAIIRRGWDGAIIHNGGVHFPRNQDTGPHASIGQLKGEEAGKVDDGGFNGAVDHPAKIARVDASH